MRSVPEYSRFVGRRRRRCGLLSGYDCSIDGEKHFCQYSLCLEYTTACAQACSTSFPVNLSLDGERKPSSATTRYVSVPIEARLSELLYLIDEGGSGDREGERKEKEQAK